MARPRTVEANLLRLRPREYTDIDLSFVPNPLTGDIGKLTNFNAVKNSIKNIIMTATAEKFFLPEFGSRVTGILFEQMDGITLNTLKEEIKFAIRAFEPRVNLAEVLTRYSEEENTVDISIRFSLKNDPGRIINFEFVLERIR